jgi:hypothetical protein
MDVAKSCSGLPALGERLLLVEASTSTHADASVDAIVRDLRKLAVLSVPLGIRIAFKGLPWSRTVKNYAAAGDLVFRANCPNLGLAIDAFDVIAAGVSPDDLDAIDPEQIFLVQLSDCMWQELRSTEEQATATHSRVFPGEAPTAKHSPISSPGSTSSVYGDYSFDVYNDDYLQIPRRSSPTGHDAPPTGSAKPCCAGHCPCPTWSACAVPHGPERIGRRAPRTRGPGLTGGIRQRRIAVVPAHAGIQRRSSKDTGFPRSRE